MSYFRGDPYIWQDGDLNVHVWSDRDPVTNEYYVKQMIGGAAFDELAVIRVAEMVESEQRFEEAANHAAESGNAGGLYKKQLAEIRHRLKSMLGVAWVAGLLVLLFLPAAGAQQIDLGGKCISRETDPDSYRLEPLRQSEIADRNALLNAVIKSTNWLIVKNVSDDHDSPEYIEWRQNSDALNDAADKLAADILAAHSITFAPTDKKTNYGTFLELNDVGPELYGLDGDKQFATVKMMGNFLLISNFKETPCGEAREFDAFSFGRSR